MTQGQRDGTDEADSESARICALSRAVLPVSALLRFVADPEGRIVPDIRRRLPGRGVNLRAEAGVVAEAVRRNVFARSLKRPVTTPPDLAGEVRRLMQADLVQALAIANKAGLVVTGFGKVEAALGAGKARAVLHAAEAAPDGVRKLAQAAFRGAEGGRPAPAVIDRFTTADFQLALGRDSVIHAALLPGPASGALLDRWRRLMRFDGVQPDSPAGPDHDQPAGQTAE